MHTLTDRFVASVKPAATTKAYADTKVRGLALRVMPSGVKSWTIRYKRRGRSLRVTFASVDVLSLADARVRARDLLNDVSQGGDPSAAHHESRRKVATVQDLAEQYITQWAKPRKRSWKADDNLLRNKVLPRWRHRAVVDITRRDVQALVQQVADAGAPIVANRLVALLSKMFRQAVRWELVTTSPAVDIDRPGREQQRDRVLTEDEIRALWQSFSALEPSMAAFYKLRLLTAQRGGEVAAMRHQDIDLVSAWWTIPAARSKNKLAHRVPLGPSSIAILRSLPPKERRLGSPVEVYVLAGARGKRQQAEAAATFTVADFRGHDLRRTAASMMASGGIPRLTISKILNHAERSITAVYDRHSYDPEKAAALAWWDAKLTAIVAHTPAAAISA